jgi:hypothetical protein
MVMVAVRLDAERSAEALRWLAPALEGDEAAARAYAIAWRDLVRDLAGEDLDPPWALEILDHLALTAPFEPEGPLRALVSVAAGMLPGMEIAAPPASPAALPRAVDYRRFARIVRSELSRGRTDLEELLTAWDLTITDVGRLFGVRRQAVQQWIELGVPAARQPKLLVILEIADLLERNLLRDRIAAVVRTPGDAYAGESMVEAIAADRHAEVLESVRRSFDWAWSA